MSALSVVFGFDVLEDIAPGLVSVVIGGLVNELGLQGGEETFDDGIVPAITSTAHGALNPMACQELLIVSAGVLDPLIRVVQKPPRGLPSLFLRCRAPSGHG